MIRIYAAIAVVIALIAGGWYMHHRGYEAGRAAGEALAAKATERQHKAEADAATLARTLRQITADTDKAKADADAAARREAKAVAQTQAVKQQADRDAAAFARQLDAATHKPECAALQERLCPSVLDY